MDRQLECKSAFALPRLQAPIGKSFAAALSLNVMALAGCAPFHGEPASKTEIGFVAISSDIKLRRMVVHSSRPKGVVLFLHGFPETLYAWKDISSTLGTDYDIHAFDWPGYGLSSRPPVDRFSYAPKDYANVLKEYIKKSGIDTSELVIYATDIGALPALMLALDEPNIEARSSWVTLPRSTDRSTCIPVCKSEIEAFSGCHPRLHEPDPGRDSGERLQERFVQERAVRSVTGVQGRHGKRMEPAEHDVGGCLLSLLFTLHP